MGLVTATESAKEWAQTQRAKREKPRPPFCLNCGAAAQEYCPKCGQQNTPHTVHILELFRDTWEEFVKVDGKLIRTLLPLLFRPGHLTREYVMGKRARYLSPVKMYLVVSALFFILVAHQSQQAIERGNIPDEFTTSRNVGYTVGKSLRDAKTPQKEGSAAASPAAVTKSPAKPKKKNITIGFDEEIDPDNLPKTIAAYEAAQAKLPAAKRHNWLKHTILRRVIEWKQRTLKANIQIGLASFLDVVPKMMFVLLPVFALLLKVLYFRSGRLYIEHFVYALHVHTAFFVYYSLTLLVPPRIAPQVSLVCNLLLVVYGFWALKTVYGQGIAKTLLKGFLLVWHYFLIFVVAATLTALVSAFLL